MRDFDKQFNRQMSFIRGMMVVGVLMSIAIIGGIGFMVWKVLVHFGIV